MAELRKLPYSQFNFLVDIGSNLTDPEYVGFQEVSGLGIEVAMAEYRNGNEVDNAPRKVPGLYKVTDVTLKRGVIGATDLYSWLDNVRTGVPEAFREVTIKLLSEDRQTTALTWVLTNAYPMKYTAPTMSGTGAEVAIEELVLACERITME